MKTVHIYRLRDPRNNEIRYVGKTVQKPKHRLRAHIREAKRGGKSYRDRWILQVLEDGKRPVIEIVEEANEDNWQEREQFWIAEYRKNGNLTNLTDGGDGLHGHEFSEQHRRRIGNAQKGNKRGLGYRHTEEHKEKMRRKMQGENNPNYGRKFSEEYREKLGKAHKGKKHSEETKEKMSKTAMGNTYGKGYKQTEEHRANIAAAKRRTRESDDE